jgi:hypothetical protein
LKSYKLDFLKKITLVIFTLVTLLNFSFAEEDAGSAKLFLNQNPLFGFTPTLELTYPISESISLKPYVEYWVNNAYSDTIGYIFPGLEFGLGVNFNLFENKMNLLTSLGIYSGNSYSGGGRFIIFDAIVPMIQMDYLITNQLKAHLKGRAWIQGRLISYKRYTYDDFELDGKLDYKLNEKFDAGLFYSQYVVNKKNQLNSTSSLYTAMVAIGPTFTFKTEKLKMQVGYGADLIDYIYTGVAASDRVVKDYYLVQLEIKL